MKKVLLIPVILALLISGCDKSGVSNNEIRKLEKAKKTWQKTKTSDYSFDFQQACFCPSFGNLNIQVFADTVYAVVDPVTGEDATIDLGNGEEKLLDLYPQVFVTIDELFEKLEKATDEADEMKGSYDAERGFPKLISIDYHKNAIDDEVSYVVGNFQVLTLTSD
jgi:hypothetical protein